MRKQLNANIITNLRYYKRNRLLLGAAIFMVFMYGMTMIPSMMLMTSTKKFEIIKMVFNSSAGFIGFIAAAMALLSVSAHKRNRSIKMIITKPCTLGTWLLANFASAILMCAVLYSLVLIVCAILFAAWSIPFQWGFIFVLLHSFCRSVILISYILFLSVLFHPGIAILIIYLFQDTTFYWLMTWVVAGTQSYPSGGMHVFMQALEKVMYGIYMTIPSMFPYEEHVRDMYHSFHVEIANWKYLFYTLEYTALITAFFYIIARYFLNRQTHT